ncbi:MAG TPA: LTA synthase family protein [Rhodanobacter sp.]|nr:LTA synthase family protein [Rhodanobacter sp.]
MSLKLPDTSVHWRPLASRIALLLSLMLAFILLTGLIDGGVGVTAAQLLKQPRFPLANAFPGLLLAGALLLWTRRAVLSFGLAFALEGLVYGVNQLKVANLGTPLLPDDFRMIGQLRKGGMHVLAGYLPHSPLPYLAMLVALVLVVLAWRMEPPLLPRHSGGKRLLAGSVLAAVLISMLAGLSAWGRIYNARVLWLEPWSAHSTANHSGLISSLVLFHLHFGGGHHKPDRAAAERLITQSAPALLQAMQQPARSGALPDIVVVQSESLFDPTIMRGYEQSDFTPNLRRLSAHGISGKLYVPTFGGGTIRTEFEVLTGLSLRYFDNMQFPYLQMSHKSLPSLVRTLETHGYSTLALHGNDPSFWNRTTAFKAIGFERFVSKSGFPADAPNDGKYMADSAMTDKIMSLLKDSGPPQFIFAISIEAHGPYDIEPADVAERDAIAVPAGITGRDKLEMQTYLYHIKHADAELGRMVSWLAKRQRPSLVLFYGDHLPALVNNFHTTGFVDGKDMLSQAGAWLLVDPHASGPARHVDTAAWLLPGQLLAEAGIHDDPYFALTQLVGPKLAALTAAPGAPRSNESSDLKQLDHAMESVDELRKSGKLAKLFPDAITAPSKHVARDEGAPEQSSAAAMH